MATIVLARYQVPARGLDPWRRPKGSWALGTRMLGAPSAAHVIAAPFQWVSIHGGPSPANLQMCCTDIAIGADLYRPHKPQVKPQLWE